MKKKKFKFTSSRARFYIAFSQQGIVFSVLLGIFLIIEKNTGFKIFDNYTAGQTMFCCMLIMIPVGVALAFIQEKTNQKNSIKLKSLLLQLRENGRVCQVEKLEDFHPDIRSEKNDTLLFWCENVCYLAGEKGCIKLGKESWLKIINKQQKISEIYIKEIEKWM